MSKVQPLPVARQNGPRDHAVVYAGVIEMSVEDWINVEDNPVQRDTERRAKKAKHLHILDAVHQETRMARLPDGQCIKLDGHTRGFLWAGGLAREGIEPRRPEYVSVSVYDCRAKVDVIALYDKFNSKAAAKTAVDEVQGAHRQLKLQFTSPLLRAGCYGQAVRLLHQRVNGYGKSSEPGYLRVCVAEFQAELAKLDAFDPGHKDFPAPFIMAALSTIRVYGKPAVEFWDDYARDAGSKIGDERDPVQALREVLLDARARRDINSATYFDMMGQAVNTVEAHLRGMTYKRVVRKKTEAQLAAFLRRVKRA